MWIGVGQAARDSRRNRVLVREIFCSEEADVALSADIDFTDANADAIRKNGHVFDRRLERFRRYRLVGRAQRHFARLGLRRSIVRRRLAMGLRRSIAAAPS